MLVICLVKFHLRTKGRSCLLFTPSPFSMVYLSDEDYAKYRTKEAIRFYKAWGADAKVRLLEEVLEDPVSAIGLSKK